jgi:hypothetical protein
MNRRIRNIARWRGRRKRLVAAALHSAQAIAPEWPIVLAWGFLRHLPAWRLFRSRS